MGRITDKVSRQHGKHRHVSKNTLTPCRKADRERGEASSKSYLDMLMKMSHGRTK